MDFKDIKMIWESQKETPLYTLDPADLHKSVGLKRRTFNRSIFFRDVREIGAGLAMAVYLIIEGVMLAIKDDGLFMHNEYDTASVAMWFLFTGAALFLFMPIYMFIGRKRQQHRERQFNISLHGDINKTICQIDYQIKLMKNVVWWGILPTFGGCAASLYAVALLQSDTRAEVLYIIGLVLPLGLLFAYWCNQRIIKKSFIPRKQDFEALHEKLNETA